MPAKVFVCNVAEKQYFQYHPFSLYLPSRCIERVKTNSRSSVDFPTCSSSNSISATENGGTKTLTRSSSSGVVQEGSPAWINSTTCRGNSDAERRTHSAASNGNKWETTDGGRRSGVSKQSVNLMRSPSYQSTTSAMKNDIK